MSQLPIIPGVYNHAHASGISFSEYDGYGGSGDFYTRRPTWVGNDTLTWVRGRHSLHFGGEYRNVQYPTHTEANGAGSFSFSDLNTGILGVPSGNSMASFLLGYVSSASATFYTLPDWKPKGDAFGAFVSDNWKATSKLSVTLGLRWDEFRPSVEKNDRTSFFDPYGANP